MKTVPFATAIFEAEQALVKEIQTDHFNLELGLVMHYDQHLPLSRSSMPPARSTTRRRISTGRKCCTGTRRGRTRSSACCASRRPSPSSCRSCASSRP
eukprot:5859015-Prymnesium_polylepis.1